MTIAVWDKTITSTTPGLGPWLKGNIEVEKVGDEELRRSGLCFRVVDAHGVTIEAGDILEVA